MRNPLSGRVARSIRDDSVGGAEHPPVGLGHTGSAAGDSDALDDADRATLLTRFRAMEAQAMRITQDLRRLYPLAKQRDKAAARIATLEADLTAARAAERRTAVAAAAARRAIESAIPCLEAWVQATQRGRQFKQDQTALVLLRDALARLDQSERGRRSGGDRAASGRA